MPPKRIFLDDKLYVQHSTIPNAGKGLFTRKRIKDREYIGTYVGDVVTDLAACKERDYIIETLPFMTAWGKWTEPILLCGKRMDNKMRWINDPRYDKGRVNCQAVQSHTGKIFICATKEILPGQEILMSYGDFYWKEEEARQLRMWTDY